MIGGGCLGFPSAQKFSCNYTSAIGDTTNIIVDIPAGFGCNQNPISGTITTGERNIKIFSPSVSMFPSEGGWVQRVTYKTSMDAEKEVSFDCTDSVDL